MAIEEIDPYRGVDQNSHGSLAVAAAELVEVAFPLEFPFQLQHTADAASAGVLAQGLVDDLGLGLSRRDLQGARKGLLVQIQGGPHDLPPDADHSADTLHRAPPRRGGMRGEARPDPLLTASWCCS